MKRRKESLANAHSLEKDYTTGTPFFEVRGTGEERKGWLETTRWTPRVGPNRLDFLAHYFTLFDKSHRLHSPLKWIKKLQLPSFVIQKKEKNPAVRSKTAGIGRYPRAAILEGSLFVPGKLRLKRCLVGQRDWLELTINRPIDSTQLFFEDI